jgi:hypothetical protein
MKRQTIAMTKASTVFTLAMPVLMALAAPSVAAAEDTPVGTFEVKFEEVANNCNNVGMAFGRANVMVEKKKGALSVDIERIPLMSGPIGKGGKLKAQSKMGATSIAGLDGKFSIAGSVVEGTISLVFVAEYYVKDKALCTQSWNVSGMRKAG